MPKSKNASPAPAMKLLTTVKAIDAAILDIHNRGTSLQADMHVAACSVLKHVGTHHDVRIVAKLLAAMPEMSRKNALKAWFEHFGPVAFGKGDEIVFVRDKATLLGDGMATQFWKFQPEQEYKAMNIISWCEQQIKKLETDQAKTGADHSGLIMALKTYQAPVAPTQQ